MYSILDAKRLIGRKVDTLDDDARNDIATWPFNVKEDEQGRLYYQVGPSSKMFREEISGLVLAEMKRIAEKDLGTAVTEAVITVPAYFNDDQRVATKAAAEIAGLKVLQLINEPTAAALAYGTHKMKRGEPKKYICVYDLGGGTFDVSIVAVHNRHVEVVSTDGLAHLGGQDFEKILFEHCSEKLLDAHGIKVSEMSAFVGAFAMQSCEKAKCFLSTMMNVEITFPSVLPGGDEFVLEITRVEFGGLIRHLIEQTESCVRKAVNAAELTVGEIDEILLVGGSSRIPMVQTMIEQVFPNKQVSNYVNVDEVVAIGAGIIGGFLGRAPGHDNLLALVDVCSLSFGIKVHDGTFATVVEKNSPLPVKRTRDYRTAHDNQTRVVIEVFQGEWRTADANLKLGTFTIDNITPAPKGTHKVNVTMMVNRNGMLEVTATIDGSENKTKSIQVRHDRNLYSKEEIEVMERTAREFQQQVERREIVNRERFALYNDLTSTKARLTQLIVNCKMNNPVIPVLITQCDQMMEWVNVKNNLQEKKTQLEEMINTIYLGEKNQELEIVNLEVENSEGDDGRKLGGQVDENEEKQDDDKEVCPAGSPNYLSFPFSPSFQFHE